MISALVLYFVHLLRYQESVELPDDKKPKLFHAVPLCRVGLTNIPIDYYVLYFFLNDVCLLNAFDDGTSMTRAIFFGFENVRTLHGQFF